MRTITDIVDVNSEGTVLQHYHHVTERGESSRRSGKGVCRVIIFDGGKTQLNLTEDYDADDIQRAYCQTSAKMQGCEAQNVAYLVATDNYGQIVPTLHKEEIYMISTRGRRFVAFIAGRTPDEGEQELISICRRPCPPRRNDFAYFLSLPEAVSVTVTEEKETL